MIGIKSAYKIILFTLIFGLIGYFIHPYFVQLSVAEMKNVTVVVINQTASLNLRILIAIIFTFIPLFYFAANKLLNIVVKREQIFIALSILISGIIFWQYKIYSIQERLKELKAAPGGKDINYIFAQEDLNLEFYLFIGLFVGVAIGTFGIFQFRKRNV